MFWLIGGKQLFEHLFEALEWPLLDWWNTQFEHSQWHGFTFYDLIFPTFLFIAGATFPFSVKKRKEQGNAGAKLYLQVVKRGMILVILGMIYNGVLDFNFEEAHYASVLGRIGLAWMFAALIYLSTEKNSVRGIWCVDLLVFYWLLMALVPAPDYPEAARFSMEGSISSYIDRMFLPGTLVFEIADSEGILGTVPAVSTALLGMLTGEFLLWDKWKEKELQRVGILFVSALLLIILGLVWNLVFPINKKLWSSSFVCFAGGLSLALLCLFYMIIDVWKFRKWAFFFKVIGANSIVAYMIKQIADIPYTGFYLFGGVIKLFPEQWIGVAECMAYIGVIWGVLYFLYHHKIFVKV